MKAGRITAVLTLLALATGHALAGAGLRYNRSPSVPTGWYRIDYNDKTPFVGDYVAFCLPESPILHEAVRRGYLGKGPCPGNTSSLLKMVAAGPGDTIEVRDSGVFVNGQPWPKSGVAIPNLQAFSGPALLNQGHYLFMSEYDSLGFDGRYLAI